MRSSSAVFSLRALAGEIVRILAVACDSDRARACSGSGTFAKNSGHGIRPLPATSLSSPKCSLSKNIAGPSFSFVNASRFWNSRVALHLDAELLDQPLGGVAVRIRRRDALRAAVSDEGAALVGELVALRVSAEVVVVVEDQDLLRVAEGAPPEVRGREARDAGADDHEVVMLARVDLTAGNWR